MRDRYRPRNPCPCCSYNAWERADDKREAQAQIDEELLWLDDSMMYEVGYWAVGKYSPEYAWPEDYLSEEYYRGVA